MGSHGGFSLRRAARRAGAVATVLLGCVATGATAQADMLQSAAGQGPPLLGGPYVAGAGGKFAGYVAFRRVTSIGASWRVPIVGQNSRLGTASTWIGAQTSGSAFIQIGTEEGQALPTSVQGPHAEAFWSDTVQSFRAAPLFPVRPGDAITASMRRVAGRWILKIRDATSGIGRAFITRREGTGTFNLPQWIQEDPSAPDSREAITYPDVVGPEMTTLALNGRPLSYSRAISDWMALPGGYLGPTPIRDDSFAIVAQRLSSVGAAFLRTAEPLTAAENRFGTFYDRWTSATPDAAVEHETDAVAANFAASAAKLRAGRWPAPAAGQIRRLAEDQTRLGSALRAAAPNGSAAVKRVVTGIGSRVGDLDIPISRELGVGQYNSFT